jgi:uncharacterized membrane protein HdeD (DUF308 family)
MRLNGETIIRYLLVGIFLVATATGLNIILQGISGIPEPGLISQASVDNELRFMSVFWVSFGVYCLTISKSVRENKKSISYIALIFFCSGVARLLSFFQSGEPIQLFVGAMALELCLPILIFALLVSIRGNKLNSPIS